MRVSVTLHPVSCRQENSKSQNLSLWNAATLSIRELKKPNFSCELLLQFSRESFIPLGPRCPTAREVERAEPPDLDLIGKV